MSSVLSSVAAAGHFPLALWCCSTRRPFSKRRAADEPGLFRWRSAYSLSQNSSSLSSLSGALESSSGSEVVPEEAAKLNSVGERATAAADIVSATMLGDAVAKRILSNISAI